MNRRSRKAPTGVRVDHALIDSIPFLNWLVEPWPTETKYLRFRSRPAAIIAAESLDGPARIISPNGMRFTFEAASLLTV